MTLRRLIVLVALLLSAPLMAHQQKIAISTLSVNPRTERLEIVHQVPVHDSEHALRRQGAKKPDIIGSADSREEFAAYVTRRFTIEIDGQSITPAYVGSEIDGGSLYIYQDAPAPRPGASIRINSQILTDVWARQENRVNISVGTGVTTFIFQAGSGPANATLGR